MVVISKMAHEVDLKLTERQIGQSLNYRMLHQKDAVCARWIKSERRVVEVVVGVLTSIYNLQACCSIQMQLISLGVSD